MSKKDSTAEIAFVEISGLQPFFAFGYFQKNKKNIGNYEKKKQNAING